MIALKTVGAVFAAHIAILSFFFFKPKSHYFVFTRVSTVLVWSAAFAVKRFKAATLVGAAIIQILVHQFAFRVSQADLSSFWWPFAQFIALHYIILLTLLSRESLSATTNRLEQSPHP